ncbi:hypothetical protein [Roseicyclus persicicus]|uniref:Uncharacterized protein n=1 Tax=Roseicyclus persicicus TaxID=2650661 RepID=A0A7X6H110_9RHOB|nr:hypothetical protein [Roseibacterium persicicum]NKX45349.1 hypothetical protein [Roseibacterium persicicum]
MLRRAFWAAAALAVPVAGALAEVPADGDAGAAPDLDCAAVYHMMALSGPPEAIAALMADRRGGALATHAAAGGLDLDDPDDVAGIAETFGARLAGWLARFDAATTEAAGDALLDEVLAGLRLCDARYGLAATPLDWID